MKPLQRFMREGKRLLSRKFLTGDKKRLNSSDYSDYIEPLEREIDLTPLDRVLDNLMDGFQPYDTLLDRDLAPELHKILDLTRREAADQGIWHYLTVIHRPDFVRHRWSFGSLAYMQKRFWGVGTWDSNTFSRLWWAAEQTHIGENYALTQNILSKQYLARAAFGRYYSMYQPALKAFIHVLGNDAQEVVEETAKRLNKLLTVYQLEGLTEEQVGEKIKLLRRAVLQDIA